MEDQDFFQASVDNAVPNEQAALNTSPSVMQAQLNTSPSLMQSNPDSQAELRPDNSLSAKLSQRESEAKLQRKITAGGHIFTSQASISMQLDCSR